MLSIRAIERESPRSNERDLHITGANICWVLAVCTCTMLNACHASSLWILIPVLTGSATKIRKLRLRECTDLLKIAIMVWVCLLRYVCWRPCPQCSSVEVVGPSRGRASGKSLRELPLEVIKAVLVRSSVLISIGLLEKEPVWTLPCPGFLSHHVIYFSYICSHFCDVLCD